MRSHIRFILATAVLFACTVFVYKNIFFSPREMYRLNKDFPNRILDWTAEEITYDKEVLSALSPDKLIYKTYHRNEDPPITLFIAYYNSLEKVDLSDSPIVCFTGQGWEIKNLSKVEIPSNLPDTPKIRVNRMIQKKLDTTMITLFWYQSASHAFCNRGIQKVSLFFDKLLGKKDNNGFVRITITVREGMSIEETNSHLSSFVQGLYPELRRFFI